MTSQAPVPPYSTADPLRVAVLTGSVRRDRIGHLITDWFAAVAAERSDVELDVLDLAGIDLPLTDTPPGGNPDSPIAGRLEAADGVVVVTPEYNHSFPAALKNAIDHHYREWARKPVAFVSYGGGSGGIRAVEQLRPVFAELSAVTMRPGVVLSAPWQQLETAGFRPDAAVAEAATATLDELVWWAAALRTARRTSGAAA